CVVFTVERRLLGWIAAAGDILRIVEPESNVESVGWRKGYVGIESEDLIQKNCLDADVTVVGMLADLNIRLIPGKSEASLEVRVRAAVCKERAALHCEQIKSQAWLDAIQVENERIVQLATKHGSVRFWSFKIIRPQAVNRRWVWDQIETD